MPARNVFFSRLLNRERRRGRVPFRVSLGQKGRVFAGREFRRFSFANTHTHTHTPLSPANLRVEIYLSTWVQTLAFLLFFFHATHITPFPLFFCFSFAPTKGKNIFYYTPVDIVEGIGQIIG